MIDSQIRSPLTTDYERWRRAVVPMPNVLSFQRVDDSFVGYRTTIDTAAHVLTLSTGASAGGPAPNAAENAGRLR